LSCGERGTELVRILEASSESLQRGGAPVKLSETFNRSGLKKAAAVTRSVGSVEIPGKAAVDRALRRARPARAEKPSKIKIVLTNENSVAQPAA
jgi:hypothetical protein